MATELKDISNSVKGINQSAGQFRQAASAHNSSISKIVKDISSVFNSQKSQISGLQRSINENLKSSSKTSSKLDQTNSLLQESISIQNNILSQMRIMVSYLKDQGISGGNIGGADGLAGGSLLKTLAALGLGGAAGAAITGGVLSSGGAKGVGESGSASEALEFFQSKGYSKEQAAGIVGNLQAESGKNLRTDSIGDGGKAYGIAEWHPDRQAKFKEVFGKDIREAGFREQLEFVDWELNNTEKKAGSAIRSAKSTSEAAAAVDQYYERSSGAHRSQRIANAEALISGKSESKDKISGSGERLIDNKDKVFKLGGGLTGNESNLQGLNTELQSAVLGALKEYQQLTGKTATITSGHRTKEEQANVGATFGIKAAPGTSNHERGAAIDISSEDARAMESMGILAKYGLHRPMGERDPVHVELARGGTSTMGLDPRTAAIRAGGQDIGYGQRGGYDMGMIQPSMMPMGMPMPMMSPMMMGRGGMNAALIGGLVGAFSPLISSMTQPKDQETVYRPSATGEKNFIPQDTKAEDITAAQYFREDQARTAKMLQQNAAEEQARRQKADETASKPREQTEQRAEDQSQTQRAAASRFNLDEEMNGKGNWATDLLRYYGLNSAIT